MRLVMTLLLLVLLTGCRTIEYTAYEGDQSTWPTSPGTFVKEFQGMKIYYGYPAHPYSVVGRGVGVNATDLNWTYTAKKHGADAVMVINSKTVNGGHIYLPGQTSTTHYGGISTTTASPSYSIPIRHAVVTAWFIKFNPYADLGFIPDTK